MSFVQYQSVLLCRVLLNVGILIAVTLSVICPVTLNFVMLSVMCSLSLSVVMLNIIDYWHADCSYAECDLSSFTEYCYAECNVFTIIQCSYTEYICLLAI